MMKTIELLQKERVLTIRQISEKLEINERYIRYDIDKINFFLSSNKSPVIEKGGKGYVFLPTDFDLDLIYQNQSFTFSKEDRIEIILLLLLINHKEIKLNQLSKKLDVARSTLKNDLREIEKRLHEYNLKIVYDNEFYLEGSPDKYLMLLYQTIKKYNYIFISGIYKFKPVNTFIENIFADSFNGVDLKEVADILRRYMTSNQLILSDDSFEWYFTNIVIVIWSSISAWPIQFEYKRLSRPESKKYLCFIEEIESLMSLSFSEEEKEYIAYLLNYTNASSMVTDGMNIRAENITFQLISQMSEEMGIDFHSDDELFTGLIAHITQLIKRIQGNVDISEDVFNILTVRDLEVYEILSRVVKNIEILDKVENESELTYLTVYFLASIRRIKDVLPKNILVVCGHGYGTSMMLKESLINDFHVNIIDTLPVYLLKNFKDWDYVDLVISTIELDSTFIGKEVIIVSPILTDENVKKIMAHGINRKKNLSHYYSINQNLKFLHEKKRDQVLEVIRNEFGYPKTVYEKKPHLFSDLINKDLITFIDGNESWIEVVKIACAPLVEYGYANELYQEEIIQNVKEYGYYSVSDDRFALLHGHSSSKIEQSGISLVVSQEKIRFGDKKVNIIFCLASKDYKEHVPAMVSLVRMIKCTDLIEEINKSKTPEDVIASIRKNEQKI